MRVRFSPAPQRRFLPFICIMHYMKISLSTKPIKETSADLLVFFVTTNWKQEIEVLGKDTLTTLIDIAKSEDFKGKAKDVIIADTNLPSKKVLIAGVGEGKKITYFDLQKTVSKVVGTVKKTKRENIVISVHPAWLKDINTKDCIQAVVEAILLSTYVFDQYKSKKEGLKIKTIAIHVPSKDTKDIREGFDLGKYISEGVYLSRDLVNEPPDIMNPTVLASKAKEIAKNNKGVQVTIYEKSDIQKLGMNAYLGVSQGSDTPPKFIRLHYKPKKATKKIVLAGKGITFDTGGLSLKPGDAMETMKCDMAGAASVLGVFSVIDKIKPNVEVIGLIAACENMPSGRAIRPGDILKAMNGKTIEVLNTDAEGRLTLADVLSFAVMREKPDGIIDCATLTGAMMVALGEDITGVFGNNTVLINKVVSAAGEAGEHVWHMPLPKMYKPLIKSNIADVRNISKSKYGGSITAALFLEEFVDNTPWVHLDMAGPAYAEKTTPLTPYGGTGFGVRLLLRMLKKY